MKRSGLGKWSIFFFLPFALMSAAFAEDLEVLLVRPNVDNVPDVQQISVTFTKTMVPLGDYEKLAGDFKIEVSPKVDCTWRWLNGTTIACPLNAPLPPSNAYEITVPAGLKALDGSVLKAAKKEKFTTLHWAVVNQFVEWKGPDSPEIFLTFNQPMNIASLGSNLSSKCGKPVVSALRKDRATDLGLDETRSYVVSFARPIGLGKTCAIDLATSAHSATGSVPSEAFSYSVTAYGEFRVTGADCTEVSDGGDRWSRKTIHSVPNGTKGHRLTACNPDSGVAISLSVPTIGKHVAGKIQVTPPFGWTDGGDGSPEHYQRYAEDEVPSIYLQSPMKGAGKHLVKLAGLKDRFGRPLQGGDEIEITTANFPPMLQLPDGYGVMEKEGPHQLGFGGVNAKAVDLRYYESHRPEDVKMWSSYDTCSENDSRRQFIYESRLKKSTVPSGGELNVPFSSPIDLSKIAPDFKFGMFVGKMESGQELSGGPFRAHRVCSNFFTVVTDLGLLAKVGFYGSGVWVHSIKTGLALKGVKVGLYSDKGPIFEGTTDGNGFLEGPGAQKWDPERDRFGNYGDKERLYVVAEAKDDFSVLPFESGRQGLDYYSFSSSGNWFSQDPLRESTNHIVHAITDRPLYKPSQKVNIKVFARHWEPRTYGLRPAKELDLEVFDALGNSVVKKTVKLSEFGTADFGFTLDASASLGTYSIMARTGNFGTTAGRFDVQVFTLPVFAVSVQPKKESFDVGDSANFLTTARYHFGGGVPNAVGEYVANFSPGAWRPKAPKWETYTFEDNLNLTIPGYERARAQEGLQVAKGSIKTDANGDAMAGVVLPTDQLKTYGKLEYGVSFKDDRGKSIGGYGSAEIFYTKFAIGLKTPKWVYEAKDEIKPEVVLLGHDEKFVSGVKIDLKLIQRDYRTVRRRGEGNYFYYDSKTKDTEIDQCSFKSGDSPKGCGLKTKAAGEYFIVATAKDDHGRVVRSAISKYVTGKEYIGWFRENHDRIDVIPEKASYAVGETVKLMVKNPYPEVDALITLERFGILKQFRKKLTQGSEVISIPIDSKEYAPGFYVGIQLIKGRVSEKLEGGVDLGKPSFKMGLSRIEVVDPDTVLKVTAKAEKEQYEPGDKTGVDLTVSSPGGSDVAELSVAVVDEKILQLSGDYENLYKLHDKFYQLRGGDVVTSQMLSFLIGRRHFGKKGAPAGGDGDSGTKVRKNILPLAYWNPSVITDKSGKASVHFELPDNLTTWRVLVVAADKQHRFGFGSGTFRTAKKLMIEPALPSFLTEGDHLNSRFTVFNRTGSATKVAGELKTTGLELASPATNELSVANDGKTYFDWKVKAPYGKTSATFEMTAKAGANRDGIRESIPIYPYASYETFATYGSTTEAKATEPLLIPAGIRPELGGLEVLVSPTLISHLDDTFRYLFDYPYTCWEQTVDRAAAFGQYSRLKQYLSIPEVTRDPKTAATELLGEMAKFQYENGGMAFWKPDPRTIDPYLTAFTGLAVQWLGEAKVSAPAGAREKLFGYIRRLVQGTEAFPSYYSARARATVLAMAAHVLANEGDDMVATVNKLHADRGNLSLFGKSFLWMAASRRPETKALLATLKNEIYSSADITSGSIQFQETSDDGFIRILHSTTRTNCSLLAAMLVEDPQGKFVEPLVRWIVAGRKSGHWNNTQENLFCQNALAQYAAVYEKDRPNYTVTGTALDQKVKGATYSDSKGKPHADAIPFTAASVGKKSELVLEKKGKGRLYYTARLRIAYSDVRTSPVNSGMQVTRNYFAKDPDGKWIPQGNVVKLKRGQVVKVVLKVNIPAFRNQVVLDDRLPAGLEPVNTALSGGSKEDAKGEKNESAGGYGWNEDDDWYGFFSSGGFYHREMRLHAVQYFSQFMNAGNYELAYTAQAIATGEFNANPAVIEQMYEPEVYGKSTPAQFIIED